MTSPNQPTFDIHNTLAAMADYPALLRRLGVIRGLNVDLNGSGIDPTKAGPITITATPSWTPALPAAQVHVAPVTTPAYLSSKRFSLYQDSRLNLVTESVDVIEVDTDSAASRLVDLARQLYYPQTFNADTAITDPELPTPVTAPTALAAPTLRNAGLSLVRTDRAADLHQRLKDVAPLLDTTTGTTLDDPKHLILGYLLDVWDDATKKWHTLCARRGTYQLPNEAAFQLDDQGCVQMATTQAAPDQPMYLHESLVRWRGWSLVAPRPGAPVATEAVPPTAGGQGIPGFSVKFAAQAGTLPRLRFGIGYHFQLRLMDAAGHADPLPADDDITFATELVRYLRFEPVVAPMVIPTAPLTEGESAHTLVIRPEPGLLGLVSDLLAPILSIPPVRWLAPAKLGQLLCEEHGKFDDLFGAPDPNLYQAIVARDGFDITQLGEPDPNRPNARFVDGPLPVAWLPDPISRGAALKVDGKIISTSFGDDWPDVHAFRLQLGDGPEGQQWDPVTRLLTFFVPRGRMITTTLSSFVNQEDLNVLGQVGWLESSGLPAKDVQAAKADIVAGQAYQVTPSRPITLVNAVRVPTTDPALVSVVPDAKNPRAVGSTAENLKVTAKVDRPSTGKLALTATWNDPIDDLSLPGPTQTTSTSTPAEVAVGYDDDPVLGTAVTFPAVHAFGDTRRHIVKYGAVATTRYMEYFAQRGAVTLNGNVAVTLSEAGIVDGTDTVTTLPTAQKDKATTYVRGTDYAVDYQKGTIARLPGSNIASGQTVEVAIVPPPVSRSTDTPTVLDLPSTTRPAVPKVAWIVPTFGWQTSSTGRRIRLGGGLRVFLERPWYSSGVGEQLAVVCGPVDTNNADLVHLVTQMGADPTFTTASPNQFPATADFPYAVSQPSGLLLSELSGEAVSAAGHNVDYDTDRQRWSCDVLLSPGASYQPFIRLVLGRYQPNSVTTDVALSPLAIAQWAQLGPNRSAAVTANTTDHAKVSVSVLGPAASEVNVMSVIVQTAPHGRDGDLDWTVVGPAAGQVLASGPFGQNDTVWSGNIELPTPRYAARYRLVLQEMEQHGSGGRLVYSDVLPVPGS